VKGAAEEKKTRPPRGPLKIPANTPGPVGHKSKGPEDSRVRKKALHGLDPSETRLILEKTPKALPTRDKAAPGIQKTQAPAKGWAGT